MNLRNALGIIFFCLLSCLLQAQVRQDNYETKWKAVDSLVRQKGLVQSALSEVNKIYSLAKQEKNGTQIIRALIYRINLQGSTREDATSSAIEELEKEIAVAGQPAQSILQSLLASVYWNYFQQHRWQIYGRTATVNFVQKDVATWSGPDFHQKIGELYLSSLREESLLKQTKLDRYDPILTKGNTRNLRPTLFDLVAHQALDYFKTDERNISKPANVFEIDDPAAFADAAAFAVHSFRTTDSLSLHFKALQLFQRLIRLHLSDPGPDALLDVDIERLIFVNAYAVDNFIITPATGGAVSGRRDAVSGSIGNKEDMYMQALAGITGRYGTVPAAAEAWYLQAQQYAGKAAEYDPSQDTSNRYGYVVAKAICEKVLSQGTGKDSSEGKTHCEALLKNIQRKELLLQTEKVNVPGQPLRTLVSWRNFGQLYVRVIRADPAVKEGLGATSWQEGYWNNLVKLPVLKTMELSLPATGDYQMHRTEIKIDALPIGEYILLASADKDFSLTKNPLTVQYFYVSSIAYVSKQHDYFVLNRESGQPLEGATIQIWDQRYDYKTSKNILEPGAIYHSDASGHFLLAPKAVRKGYEQQLLEISTTGDHLFLTDDRANVYYNEEDNKEEDYKTAYENANEQTFFFTDRSIYRPGQVVYFKGIVVTRDYTTRQSKLLPSFATKVILYDAGNSKVDSLTLTTNEFGSFHGRFTLPEHLLNGEFRIADDSTSGDARFSVEEYKRPKFYVEYTKLKGSYRVWDTIRVSGAAKAYAGNTIGGAMVKYRVMRTARYRYPLYGSWRRPYPTQGQEIAHGTIRTNAEGKFNIAFPAIPDLHTKDSVFEYLVSADITDINGETRSGETMVPVGYTVLQLTIYQPEDDHLPADSLKELAIRTTNLSGEPEPAAVRVVIYRLRAPDHLIRSRLWDDPDQFVIPEAAYRAAFPHDEYGDEAKMESWQREEQPAASFQLQAASDKLRAGADSVRRQAGGQGPTGGHTGDSERVSSDARYRLQGEKLSSGWYVIEARAKDKYGQEIKSLRYIELYDGETGKPAIPQYNWAMEPPGAAAPGEKASVGVGSSAENIFVIRKIERAGADGRADGDGSGNMPVGRADAGGRDDADGRADGKFSYLKLDGERKKVEIPVTEADRGGFGVSDVFIKDNRVYMNQQVVKVPWTNKELEIQYTSFRDKTLPGSEEQWQVKIAGYKKDKVAAEAVAAMYDASLDQFKMHNWSAPGLYPSYSPSSYWNSGGNFIVVQSQLKYLMQEAERGYVKIYDHLLPVGAEVRIQLRGVAYNAVATPQNQMAVSGDMNVPAEKMKAGGKPAMSQVADTRIDGDGSKLLLKDTIVSANDQAPPPDHSPVQVRRDLKETAFFFPDLRTDSAGNVSFSFTMPEALTRWKWMMLAHTRDLSFGYAEKSVVTQKKLMVQPNAPRFLREGDRIELSAKIVNLTDTELTGQVALQLTDPMSGQTADGWFINQQPNQYFTVGAGQSSVVSFPLSIPYQYNRPLSYRIVARAPLPHPSAGGVKEEVSDGEEAVLPVVSNRMLVTETLPLNMRGDGSRNFTFDKLLQSGSSETLSQYALTVEFTSNPAWYAVQALPYLMEYPFECAEQTFNRFYANALASKIAGSSPRIRQIFDRWKLTDTAALLSNLEKNSELKSVLLQETPWVLQGKSESQQKRNIALLFDMTRMSRELESSLAKLQDLQSPNGGFVWFKGGPDDRYITQYILTGIGRLQKLQALPATSAAKIKAIVTAALPYLDRQIKKDYGDVKKQPKSGDKPGWVSELAVQYLYMRSSFSEYGIPGDVFAAVNYYRKQAQQLWLQTSKYMQGMIALALYRTGDVQTAKNILASLRQNAIRDEEKGMYWKGMEGGYYWYQAPIEMQSLLIEAFHEIGGNASVEDDLQTWLLKQKQTHNWRTTKATADACYALLLGGGDWLGVEKKVTIRLGDKTVSSEEGATSGADGGAGVEASDSVAGKAGAGGRLAGSGAAEAGTGYFKKVFDGPFVNPSMGNITVTMSTPAAAGDRAGMSRGAKQGKGDETAAAGGLPAWGAVYWQYFDNLDRITPPGGSKAPLKLVKKIFVERNTDRGPVLEPVEEKGILHVGDKVKVRIELQADRELEYVHMKDMRASAMEPVNVLSGFKWQGGLGYYESTKDVSTDFFFSRLPRGTYIFEYPLFVGQVGDFSNGITSIECMYAPEFAFHSEGIRLSVE